LLVIITLGAGHDMNESGTWKRWASELKKNIYALYLASRNPNVPLLAKIIIGVVVAYALSPIDLVPDFIPVIGYIDDLLLLPLGIWLAIKLIPKDVWRECQLLAREQVSELSSNRCAAAIIVIIWILIVIFLMLISWKYVRGRLSP
jgi:uncharacterized membrane protein YkvA (DUF1232 family)